MYENFVPERLAKLRTQKGVSARDMSLSLGPFITCFLCTNILCIILHYLIYKKKIFFDKSLRFIFWIIGIILLRMVLPFNFPFTYTSYSDNILPKIVDFIYYNMGK